jgi:hypothetical protein
MRFICKISIQEGGMKKAKEENNKINISLILVIIFIFLGMVKICAAGFLGFGDSASWKEEVLLHDGSKIIVERWQKHGGRHEPGQRPGIAERSINFTLPGTKNIIKWKDEYSEDVGRSSLKPLALDIINGTIYIVTTPVGMLAYNKWDRPNPPYIFFKFSGKDEKWERITLAELPVEFKNINLVIDTMNNEEELVRQGIISAEKVKEFNSRLTQEEYKTIVRTPLKTMNEPIMVPTKEGGWLSIDWFTSQPSYEACKNFSKRKKVRTEHCPCNAIFKGGK